jgi:hypothetical protein
VLVALVIQHVKGVRRFILSVDSRAVLCFSTLSNKRQEFRKTFVVFFVFCTTFVRNVSHFTKNSAIYVGLHAQCPLFLSHVNES